MGRTAAESPRPVEEPEPDVVKPVKTTRASRAAARKEAEAAARSQPEEPTTLTTATAATKAAPERPHGVIHPVSIKSTVVDTSVTADVTPSAAVSVAAPTSAGGPSKATVAPVDLGRDMTPAPTEKDIVPEKETVTPLKGAATTAKPTKKRVVQPVTIAPSVAAPTDDNSGGVPR